MLHLLQICCQPFQSKIPKFAHEEPTLANGAVKMFDEIEEESFGVMLDCVESEALETEFFTDPWSPGFDIGLHFWVRVVEIGEHKVVCKC